MTHLPVDERGYPVPWFIGMVDGKYDFRTIRPNGIAIAISHRKCWLCGERLGVHQVFVIGPMCALTRVTMEPPCHLECAEFAARACPFLTHPLAKRGGDEDLLAAGATQPPGVHLTRNPGAVCLWATRSFTRIAANGGSLINVGEPETITWWARGRAATRAEIMDSINSGIPLLAKVEQRPLTEIDDLLAELQPWLPRA